MITVRMRSEQLNVVPTWRAHRVAGCVLLTDVVLSELAPFAAGDQIPPVAPPVVSLPDATNLVYCGPGWLASQQVDVECRSGADGYRLRVAGAGCFSITTDGRLAALVEEESVSQSVVVVDALLGPVLILALALQGTWCLHASAVRVEDRAVAFLGGSGHGKSTLAAYLGAENTQEWVRLVDDILPVGQASGGPDALPHFPQLKLPPEAQVVVCQPERLPLAAIYILTRPKPGQKAAEIQPLTTREAALALVRHTVAARLFDSKLLERHLSFCSWLAGHVPVRRLAYPRRQEILPHLRDVVAAELHTL